ncbi:site-2 protease family protein [Lihuaxuella thermophila]|uniref:Zn-dependent protease (Includes SpoIVFB) n=1 Tax=Lihuaxuella thermophila TaxID=1173111 RepID=A0A1H8HTK4_9BACL|nr:site-2 protease family protein [Lihuaxuella thermophila]SEN59236.1 Zn-dependent protease (includes SpoIVFB) [Lihuaxuella thermophila]
MDQEESKKPRGRLVSWLGWLGVLLISVGGKLKSILPLLKFGKFGGTLISMAVSVGGYALFYPFEFAIGLVVMIFIHEMGHVWAAKRKGLPVSAPAFIPFLGALITMKKQPTDAATEAYIAYGGPLIGSLGALACYGVGVWTGNELFYVIAMVGFFLNLFNLIPIHPLDGGRIVTAITRWLWVFGLVVGLIVIIYLRSWLLALIYLMFVWELWAVYGRSRRKKKMKPQTYLLAQDIDPVKFEESGIWIPGEDHQRPLPFTQYCRLDTREHVLEAEFPGLENVMRFEGMPPGVARRVQLVKTTRPTFEHPYVRMHLEVDYLVSGREAVGGIQRDDKYYSVPVKTRWAFGLAYVGLAGFLIYMLYVLGQVAPDLSAVS